MVMSLVDLLLAGRGTNDLPRGNVLALGELDALVLGRPKPKWNE
jgi:hypothetical protein